MRLLSTKFVLLAEAVDAAAAELGALYSDHPRAVAWVMSELNHERAIAEGVLVGALPKYEPIPSGWFAQWVLEGTLLIDRRSLPRDPQEITIVSARGSAMRRIVNGWPVVYLDVRVQAVAPPAPTEYHTGLVGRPSGINIVEQQMRRRAETGELLPSLHQEAQLLALWYRERHPDGPRTAWKTIENNLRSVYRELKSAPAWKNSRGG